MEELLPWSLADVKEIVTQTTIGKIKESAFHLNTFLHNSLFLFPSTVLRVIWLAFKGVQETHQYQVARAAIQIPPARIIAFSRPTWIEEALLLHNLRPNKSNGVPIFLWPCVKVRLGHLFHVIIIFHTNLFFVSSLGDCDSDFDCKFSDVESACVSSSYDVGLLKMTSLFVIIFRRSRRSCLL